MPRTRNKAGAEPVEHDDPYESSTSGQGAASDETYSPDTKEPVEHDDPYESSTSGQGAASDETYSPDTKAPRGSKKRPSPDKASEPNKRGGKAAKRIVASGRSAEQSSAARQAEEAPRDAYEAVRWFQKRIDAGEILVDELKRRLNEADATAKKHLDKANDFRDKLRLQKEATKSAEQKISLLEHEVDNLTEQYEECLAEIPKPYYGDPNKVTDDIIAAKWGRLEYVISVLAMQCLDMTPDQIRTTFSGLLGADIIELCQRKPVLAGFVIHRFIWDELRRVVFLGEGNFWGGSFGTLFIKMVKALRKSDPNNAVNLQLISKLKFTIAKDIEESIPKDEKAIKAAAEHLISRLSSFVREGKQSLFEEYAHKIFKKALKLLSTFTRSKAIFFLAYPGKAGDRFDPGKMRVKMTDSWDLEKDDLRLDFFVSPALNKIGTAGGDMFDCSGFIIQGGVVVHVHEETSKDSSGDKVVKMEEDAVVVHVHEETSKDSSGDKVVKRIHTHKGYLRSAYVFFPFNLSSSNMW
ncbi:hypothetical protein L249_6929 [Ophiocordyceps polyrhachis-furcata BCC 54312]|uniref:Uncharacterized protein n=1 Tax=Ophiocordyceps polyrhachis-furcata BCC 54312 TaxID=1330021 RepID=A0A367LLC1_9HYPO|nr:hypothetical protein L249_6929 [Ophiocordyceps polyrhachis-furcata BCC 54312]